jgi:hypothetical protein
MNQMKNYGQEQDNILIKLKGGNMPHLGQNMLSRFSLHLKYVLDGTGQRESFTTDPNSRTETNDDNMKCGKVTDL